LFCHAERRLVLSSRVISRIPTDPETNYRVLVFRPCPRGILIMPETATRLRSYKGIGSAASSPDQAWPLVVDADPLIVATDVAVPLALIVNELVSNALQHSKLIGEGGGIRILLRTHPGSFEVSVADPGGWSRRRPTQCWARHANR
jgi:signal transduction histidine kinase